MLVLARPASPARIRTAHVKHQETQIVAERPPQAQNSAISPVQSKARTLRAAQRKKADRVAESQHAIEHLPLVVFSKRKKVESARRKK